MSPRDEGRLWGSRFEDRPATLFDRINSSLAVDRVLYPEDLRGSRTHVRMLGATGILTEDETKTILEGLDRVETELAEGTLEWAEGDEDIHTAVERRLTEIVGPVGGKLHTARSRNDQIALDVQLYLRAAVAGHVDGIMALMVGLLEKAAAHKDLVMPGYTHLQRAQPVSVAHHLLAYFFMLERDVRRFLSWHESCWLPLGAGALAGTGYRTDRDLMARELSYERVAPNAADAVASRDWALEYLSDAMIASLNLSRLAEEIVLWSSQEFGFIELPDAWTSGSSIMPQKKNPDAAELVRAKTAGFVGRVTAFATLLKGLPLTYNKDLQEDKPPLRATREELDLCLEVMRALVDVMQFKAEALRSAAEGGYSQATDVADYLVSRGLSFREAHDAAGRLVRIAAESGRPLADLGPAELQSVSAVFDEEYYSVVSLERVLETKISAGGTSSGRIQEQLAEATRRLDELRGLAAQQPR